MFALSPDHASASELSVNAASLYPLHHTYAVPENCQAVSRPNLPLLSTAVVPVLALLDEQGQARGMET